MIVLGPGPIGILCAAMARLADTDLALVVCSSHPPHIGLARKARAVRLGIGNRILGRHELSRETLAPWLAHALCTLAPLAESPRRPGRPSRWGSLPAVPA